MSKLGFVDDRKDLGCMLDVPVVGWVLEGPCDRCQSTPSGVTRSGHVNLSNLESSSAPRREPTRGAKGG